ncbi:MAG: 50S ribosomal protein L10 [Tenericutes bacterium]|nr:MAG: 50S ribosomal protein L10 [Mycoplasmatota bacterium]
MNVNREKKVKQIQDLAKVFEQNSTLYLIDYKKISVTKSIELRTQLRENDCSLKVIKNRLALRALTDELPLELKQHFQGPTAIAFTDENPIILARLLKDFIVQNKILKVKAGLVEGEFLSEGQFPEIANLTSRDDLLAKLGYLIVYPLTQLLKTWQAPFNSFGSMLSQLKSKK